MFYNALRNKQFPTNLNKEITNVKFLLGSKECLKHQMVEPYPVLSEKKNEYIARVKFTVLITENGPTIISALPSAPELQKIK